MEYIVKFYKDDNKWYADMPQHTKEDNEMVMGADTFIEAFSIDGKTCQIRFDTEEPKDGYAIKLERGEHDWDGAYYTATGPCCNGDEVWICNVTHTLCGEHPETMYITDIG